MKLDQKFVKYLGKIKDHYYYLLVKSVPHWIHYQNIPTEFAAVQAVSMGFYYTVNSRQLFDCRDMVTGPPNSVPSIRPFKSNTVPEEGHASE